MRKTSALAITTLILLSTVVFACVENAAAQEHPYTHRHDIKLDATMVEVDYLGTATVNGTFSTSVTPYDYVKVYATASIETPDAGGWGVIVMPPIFRLVGNEPVEFELFFINGPPIKKDTILVRVNLTLELYDTDDQYLEATILARASPYSATLLSMSEAPKTVKPNGLATYPIEVDHLGNYYEHYSLTVDAPRGWHASIQSSLVVFPGETGIANLTVNAPEKFYSPGEIGLVTVKARSSGDPETTYSIPVVVIVKGVYVSSYIKWIVIPIVILVSIVLFFILWIILWPIHRHLQEYRGRPWRPWRYPEEKAYLLTLRETEGFGAMMRKKRLMRPEYRSALLWWKWEKKGGRIHDKKWKKTHKSEWKAQKPERRRAKRLKKLQKRVEKKQYKLDNKFEKRWKKSWKRPHKRWKKTCHKLKKAHRKPFKKERKVWRKEKKRARKLFKKEKKRGLKQWKKETRCVEKEYSKINRKRRKEGVDEEIAPLPLKPKPKKPERTPKPKRSMPDYPPEPKKPERPTIPQYSIDKSWLKILKPGEKPRPPRPETEKAPALPLDKRIAGAVASLLKPKPREERAPKPVKPAKQPKPIAQPKVPERKLTSAEHERERMRRRADATKAKERVRLDRSIAKERARAEKPVAKERAKAETVLAREKAAMRSERSKAQRAAEIEQRRMDKQKAKERSRVDAEKRKSKKIVGRERRKAEKTRMAAAKERTTLDRQMERKKAKAMPKPARSVAKPVAEPEAFKKPQQQVVDRDELQRQREKELAKMRKLREKEKARAKKTAEKHKKRAERERNKHF